MGKTSTAKPFRVESLDFRRTTMVWHDGWRGRDRICRWTGNCVVCGTRTYAFDDGENDPRGALGDHAASGLDPVENGRPDGLGLTEIPLCFMCANEYDRYKIAMRIAERRWDRQELAARQDD